MSRRDELQSGPEPGGALTQRATRRKVIKAGAAMAGGMALSPAYAEPGILSVSLNQTSYASGKRVVRKQGPPQVPPQLPPEALPLVDSQPVGLAKGQKDNIPPTGQVAPDTGPKASPRPAGPEVAPIPPTPQPAPAPQPSGPTKPPQQSSPQPAAGPQPTNLTKASQPSGAPPAAPAQPASLTRAPAPNPKR